MIFDDLRSCITSQDLNKFFKIVYVLYVRSNQSSETCMVCGFGSVGVCGRVWVGVWVLYYEYVKLCLHGYACEC